MLKRVRAALAPSAKQAFRRVVPLALRKRLAVRIGRSGHPHAYYWTMELLRDLAVRDPDAFHRFLWSRHLAYAETYEVDQRFDAENIHPSRRLLFEELGRVLDEQDIAAEGIGSVLEVGCSLGYLLRYLETTVLPGTEVLDGIDIDGPAIEEGSRHLERLGSRVRLRRGDMAEIDALLGRTSYDLVLCAGTLMYLNEEAAGRVVDAMLSRTDRLLVLTGLADPEQDNAMLDSSGVRERDRSFIHNLDTMVEAAGGSVVARRWDGDRVVDGNTIYFVFAEPARTRTSDGCPTSSPERILGAR